MSKPQTPQPTNSTTLLLRRQLQDLTKRPVEGFSAGWFIPPDLDLSVIDIGA